MVAGRVPDFGIDAVDDAMHDMGTASDNAFQPHAEFRRKDFFGVRRADGGDRRCRLYATLQKADIVVIFDAFGVEGMCRKTELAKNVGAELALEGNVVDGENAGNFRGFGIAHIDRRHGCLPVMRMHQVRLPARQFASGDFSCRQ